MKPTQPLQGPEQFGRVAELLADVELIPGLASRGITDPLLRAINHPSADVRRSFVNALASVPDDAIDSAIARRIDDDNATVRLAALRALVRRGRAAPLGDRIHDLAQDPDPQVRGEAALQLGDDGKQVLGVSRSRIEVASSGPADLLDFRVRSFQILHKLGPFAEQCVEGFYVELCGSHYGTITHPISVIMP